MNWTGVAALMIAIQGVAGCSADLVGDDPVAEQFGPCRPVIALDRQWRAGCATRHNLIALAEQPDDLYAPRPEAPRDSMYRDGIFQNHGRRNAPSQSQPTVRTVATGAQSNTGGAQ